MDELTFLFILAGIGVVLLIALFTYYKYHKKIHDEIQDINQHAHAIDDVLLNERPSQHDRLGDAELPDSFYADKTENIDIDKFFGHADEAPAAAPPPRDFESVAQAAAQAYTPAPDGSIDVRPAETSGNERKGETPVDAQVAPSPDESLLEKPGADVVATKPVVTARDTAAHKFEQPEKQLVRVIHEPLPEGVEELILALTIVSRSRMLNGDEIVAALETAGLVFGEMNIFHYPGDKSRESFALFSVANLVEPGTFDLDNMHEFTSPGLSLFMNLPGRIPAITAFERFIKVAKKLAQLLDAELCDETRSLLTQQAIMHKKEQVKQLQFNITKAQKLAALKK